MDIQELIHIFGIAKQNNFDICVELNIPHDFVITLNSDLDNKLSYYTNSNIKIINAFPIKWLRK